MKFFSKFALIGAITASLLSPVAAFGQGWSTQFLQPPNSTPVPALSDIAGRQYVVVDGSAVAAITTVQSSSALASSQLVATNKTLVGTAITTTAAGYLMIFNATSAPADGAVTPVFCFYTSGAPGSVSYALNTYFSTGITLVYSSTGCFTKTASATAMFMTWSLP